VVARLESGDLDSRLSTIERFAAAVGLEVDLVVREPSPADVAAEDGGPFPAVRGPSGSIVG